jgi:hypothetical protein
MEKLGLKVQLSEAAIGPRDYMDIQSLKKLPAALV